jgi:hypothetical protein
MPVGNPIRDLQVFIDERWAVAQPKFYSSIAEGPRVPAKVTPREAAWFLDCVTGLGDEPPLLVVDDDRKERSDRYPRLSDGRPRGYLFFEEPGRLRLETIVGWAAVARLRDEFGSPPEHLVCESPTLLNDGREVLRYEALDILALEEPCVKPAAKMPVQAARSRVGVEAKATPRMLEKLLAGMRACQTDRTRHSRSDHVKCSAIAVLRPRLFLGVAAAETWRLFNVVERDGRAVLGDELPDLDRLRFAAASEPA